MDSLQGDIRKILEDYLLLDTYTATEKENQTGRFFADYIGSIPYFRENPGCFGSEKIPGDGLGRSVHWALVRQGTSPKTVVMIHHADIVNIDNYNELSPLAFLPEKLSEALKGHPASLDGEARKDLESGEWLFGRGTADMKGGGALQLALLKEFSFDGSFDGNVMVLIVPDEENLSAGMRYGVKILKRLQQEKGLDYALMINSEPHQRVQYDKGVISQGSIAKMNFFVYLKGILTHAGKILEGVNPVGIMSRILAETEMNLDFVDRIDGEMSIPPTWVHIKDSKTAYDISTPESLIGYFNILNFSTSPAVIMDKLKEICRQEAERFLEKHKAIYDVFKKQTDRVQDSEEWKVNILTYRELRDMLREKGAETFARHEKQGDAIIGRLKRNELTFIEADRQIVDSMLRLLNRQEVFIVVGLTIPFYPAVSNYFEEGGTDYLKLVNDFTMKEWNQEYMNRYFFTGISDLSYSSLNYDFDSTMEQMHNMPLWDRFYSIPFEEIRDIRMPCLNIGPWGKDFHKISERVYKEDLLVRTPQIIKKVIQRTFGKGV